MGFRIPLHTWRSGIRTTLNRTDEASQPTGGMVVPGIGARCQSSIAQPIGKFWTFSNYPKAPSPVERRNFISPISVFWDSFLAGLEFPIYEQQRHIWLPAFFWVAGLPAAGQLPELRWR